MDRHSSRVEKYRPGDRPFRAAAYHASFQADGGRGYAVIAACYGNSDWTDTPTPMLSHPDKVGAIPKATMPTLESHIYVEDTTEARHLVAKKTPLLEPADDEDHTVACHRFRELGGGDRDHVNGVGCGSAVRPPHEVPTSRYCWNNQESLRLFIFLNVYSNRCFP